MTVKQFKELVNSIPATHDDWVVVMSSDPEGNSFNYLHEDSISYDETEISTQYYDLDERELISFDENEDEGDTFEDFITDISYYPNLKPCIVIWP